MVKFDGTNWTVYQNSLSLGWIRAVHTDGFNNVWLGSISNGMAKFDGSVWTHYHKNNSGLPSNGVRVLKIDGNNNIWMGVYNHGLTKFDGSIWTLYNKSNFNCIENNCNNIAIYMSLDCSHLTYCKIC